MGVCAMLICVQRDIVTFSLNFPDWTVCLWIHSVCLYSCFTGFVPAARRLKVLLIILKEPIYSNMSSRLVLKGRQCPGGSQFKEVLAA